MKIGNPLTEKLIDSSCKPNNIICLTIESDLSFEITRITYGIWELTCLEIFRNIINNAHENWK